MTQTIPINLPESIVEQFCQRYHIKKLSLFGSILRDDFSPDSDIDCLVEFTPEHVPGLFSLSIMQDELSEIVARTVDLRTPNELSNYFREQVLTEAMIIYDGN